MMRALFTSEAQQNATKVEHRQDMGGSCYEDALHLNYGFLLITKASTLLDWVYLFCPVLTGG